MKIDQYIDKFCTNYNTSRTVAERLLAHAKEINISQGRTLVKFGTYNDTMFILKSGICRAFIPKQECGVTQWFAFGGEMVASMSCYYGQTSSTIEIEAETNCEMFVIEKTKLENLCAIQIDIANIIRRMFERHAFVYEENIQAVFGCSDAMERYLSLLKRHPELLQNVPLKKLASYLLVTPQSLSRTRTNLKE